MAMVNSKAGSKKQRAVAGFAADQHLAGAERDRPDQIGVEHGPPVLEAEADMAPARVENLDEENDAEQPSEARAIRARARILPACAICRRERRPEADRRCSGDALQH